MDELIKKLQNNILKLNKNIKQLDALSDKMKLREIEQILNYYFDTSISPKSCIFKIDMIINPDKYLKKDAILTVEELLRYIIINYNRKNITISYNVLPKVVFLVDYYYSGIFNKSIVKDPGYYISDSGVSARNAWNIYISKNIKIDENKVLLNNEIYKNINLVIDAILFDIHKHCNDSNSYNSENICWSFYAWLSRCTSFYKNNITKKDEPLSSSDINFAECFRNDLKNGKIGELSYNYVFPEERIKSNDSLKSDSINKIKKDKKHINKPTLERVPDND